MKSLSITNHEHPRGDVNFDLHRQIGKMLLSILIRVSHHTKNVQKLG